MYLTTFCSTCGLLSCQEDKLKTHRCFLGLLIGSHWLGRFRFDVVLSRYPGCVYSVSISLL